MTDSYLAASVDSCAELVIERSKFIGYACYVKSEDEAKEFVARIKKAHSAATHNCYAYIAELGRSVKFFDDGEPKGTAGTPILEVLNNKGLVNTAVVVTRYFGGIKLGAGGLVRAYTQAAALALEGAQIREYALCERVEIAVSYDLLPALNAFLAQSDIELKNAEYGESVKGELYLPVAEVEKVAADLNDYLNGKVKIAMTGEKNYRILK